MNRSILTAALLALTLATASYAADAIWHHDTPGQTLYARIRTSATTSVAAAMTEGTSAGVGFYYVTDATLSGAGLSGTATYPYKIFVGTPSTTANDPAVGIGSLRWNSTAAQDLLATINTALGVVDDLVDDLEGRLTNARATYLDNLSAGAVALEASLGTPQTGDAYARLGAPAGASIAADIAGIEAGGGTEPDDRDLGPVEHMYQLRRTGSGAWRSINPKRVHPGDSNIRLGFDCSPLLAPGDYISTEDNVSHDGGDDLTVADIGHDAKVAKVEMDVAADAEATDDPETPDIEGYWIELEITTVLGAGPKTVYGQVIVEDAP